MIPLHLLPDTLPYVGVGEDMGDGPTELDPVQVRCRVEPKTKLITYAEGRTANASAFVILEPTLQPQLEARLGGWRILATETFRDLAGQVHHHEAWVGW
jgi:hypothetical protein